MDFKKAGKALLFPHIAIMIMLIPVSAVFLVCSLVYFDTRSVTAIISYVLSFYTLTVWCVKIPRLICFIKNFKNENKYVQLWTEDTGLRVNVSLYGALILNTAYAVFQLRLGFWHHSIWYYSLAGYYILLAIMRFFLVRHSGRHKAGEKIHEEFIRYRICGILLLVINIFLTAIIIFMVYGNRTFIHHEITTIAMATYTFTAFTVAIVSTVRYRKYNSPVYSASKIISLTAACVSMLTLESTMLATFNDGTVNEHFRRILMGASGGVVSVFIIVMALHMLFARFKTK